MSRRVLINLVAFLAVFGVTVWWAVTNIITFDFIERPYQIKGEFEATAGVSDNAEVAYLGVNYGAVRDVEMVEDHVVITMDIDRGKEIPAGSRARIFRKSAVGEPYIDFEPPEDYEQGDPAIEEDAVIPLEQTTVPLEFSELLRTASRVIASVDPDQTEILVHELAVALEGRSDTLRDLTVSSDALLQTFADNTELLDSLSDSSTLLTRTVTEKRGELSSAITDLADLAETLGTVEPDTNILLDRGTELLGRAADLVDDVKLNLDCVLHDLDDVIDVTGTDRNLENTRFLLRNAAEGLGYVYMTRDEEPGGLWVRVHLVVDFDSPAQQYVPPTELPAVPEVPPCVSTLTSGGDVRFDTAGGVGAVGAGTGTMPATGGNPLAATALLVVTAALALVHARRSTAE